jgi:hypothetical protein
VLDQPSDGAVRRSTSAAVRSCSARSRIARHLRGERAADDEKGEGLMGDEYDDMLDSGLTTEDGLAEAFGMDIDN